MPKWNGGVIGVANNPTISSAKGIWSLSEATKAIRAGLWPPSNAGADPYFENVTMLLSANGTNGAQNNTFLDSSTNAFTITRNGNTTQGTFTPFSKPDGRWSNYFDGAGGSYLTTSTTSTALAMGSGEFTIEAWIFTADTSFMIACSTTSAGCGFGYNIDSGTQGLWLGRAGTGVDATSGVQLAYNTWNHVAVTRDGSNVVKFWVNGTQSGSNTTVTTNYGTSAQAVRIAADGISAATFGLAGYVSNLRITKGAALYTGTFTPSTAPLTTTVSSGTVSLLACQSNRFIDNSTNAFTLTVAGSGTTVQTFSPFPALTAYAAGTNGGSGYFDGSGDYLTASANNAFNFGTGDFTVEGWIYPTRSGSNALWGNGPTSAGSFGIAINSSSKLQMDYYGGTSLAGATSVQLNAWNYFAFVRSGSNLYIYLNGVRDASTTTSSNNSTNNFVLGRGWTNDASNEWLGYISDFRISDAAALYTASTMTVPTTPLTAIASTTTLLNFTNGGIVDAAMSNDLETVGNAQISTTQSKFGGSSIYLDGSGDYVIGPANTLADFGTGDFTVEFWMNASAAGTYVIVVGTQSISGNTTAGIWNIKNRANSANGLYFTYTAGNAFNDITFSTTNYNDGTWRHIAVTRASGSLRAFVDGTQVGSTQTVTASLSSGQRVNVGWNAQDTQYYTGYVDDLRITKGYARYTSNFTPPTASFNAFGD